MDSLNVKGNMSGEEKRKKIASFIDTEKSIDGLFATFYVCPQ